GPMGLMDGFVVGYTTTGGVLHQTVNIETNANLVNAGLTGSVMSAACGVGGQRIAIVVDVDTPPNSTSYLLGYDGDGLPLSNFQPVALPPAMFLPQIAIQPDRGIVLGFTTFNGDVGQARTIQIQRYDSVGMLSQTHSIYLNGSNVLAAALVGGPD